MHFLPTMHLGKSIRRTYMEINAKHNQIHNPRLVLQGETERKCGNAKKKLRDLHYLIQQSNGNYTKYKKFSR